MNLSLSQAELALIVELLEREQDELPSEIHHTDRREYHEKLQERLKRVDLLLERLRAAPVAEQ